MLTDGVIELRHPTMADVEAIVEACQDPDIPKWTNVPSPYTDADAIWWIEKTIEERSLGQTEAFLAFRGGELAASCSLMELGRRPGYGEVGYWVAAPARRRGVASRAVRLLCAFGANELALTHIELLAHQDNVASRRTAERAGFVATGELREAPRQAAPGPRDHVVYAWSVS